MNADEEKKQMVRNNLFFRGYCSCSSIMGPEEDWPQRTYANLGRRYATIVTHRRLSVQAEGRLRG